jgi:uncharacterized protein (DUF1697 family)
MADTRYLALLRGINVGGGNIIRMADLRACFERCGLRNVATYIQSGNVLFEAAETDRGKLVRKLEQASSETFSPYKARIVLRSHAELGRVVQEAPEGFGSQPRTHRYDVIYLRAPLAAPEAMRHLSAEPGVDEAFAGPDVVYFARLAAKAGRSRLARIAGLPVYQEMTVRNWNTTGKLLALMDAWTPG